MSAFIISDNHLIYLVHAGLAFGRQFPVRWQAPDTEEPPGSEDYEAGSPWGPTAVETGQRKARTLTPETADSTLLMLYAANVASVNFRYAGKADEPDSFPRYRHSDRHDLNPVKVLKALACYEYQSCEHPDWPHSEAFDFCASLRKAAINALPGYDEANWSID